MHDLSSREYQGDRDREKRMSPGRKMTFICFAYRFICQARVDSVLDSIEYRSA